VPLALGIVPVGMSKATWGDDDDNGVLPWVEEKLDELGADTPVLFDETDGIDYEAVADTEPDVILASYSGLTQEEYDTLSKIAPVIAYPEVAWGTSVNDMIEMDSKALGLEDEGKALIKQLDADAQKALEANSVLKDKKVLFSYIDPTDLSQIGYYTAIDTRPGYLHGLGLPFPSIVEENKDSNEFYLTVSSEEAQKFDDVDLFITYGDESIIPLLQADPCCRRSRPSPRAASRSCPTPRRSPHPRTPRRCRSRGASATTSRSWLHRSLRSRSIRPRGVNTQ
jgi:iron complex transport system substrate-binding protein